MSSQSSARRRRRDALVGTPTSVLVMAGATVVAIAGLTRVGGGVGPLAIAVVTGGLLAGTTAASAHQSPLGRALVSGGAIVSAIGLLATVVIPVVLSPLSVQTGLQAGILLCVSLAVFGVGATLSGGFGNRTLLVTVPSLLLASVTIGLTALVLQLRTAPGPLVTPVVTTLQLDAHHQILRRMQQAVFTPRDPVVGVVTFGLLCVGWFVTLSFVIDRLPLVELTAQSNNARVRASRAYIKQAARYGVGLTVLMTPVVLVLAFTPLPGPLAQLNAMPFAVSLAEWLTALHQLRGVLMDLSLLLWGAVVVTALPRLTRVSTDRLTRWLPVILGSLTGFVGVSVLYPRLSAALVEPLLQSMAGSGPLLVLPGVGIRVRPTTLEQLLVPGTTGVLAPPRTTVTAVALIGLLLVFTVFLIMLSMLAGLRLLPSHATPGALAAGSVFLAGTLAGLAGGAPVVVVGVIVCALLIWDLAEYGTTLRAELGDDASMRLPVVTHTLGAVLVGGISMALAVAVDRVVLQSVTLPMNITVVITLLVALVSSAALLSKSAF